MKNLEIYRVKIQTKNESFNCCESDLILDAGLRHGLAMRYECSNGTCGVCKAKLIKGKIKKIKHHDYSLSAAEVDNHDFLMC
jgi:CDP-4-dehydro-6-deoxyglucose reductase